MCVCRTGASVDGYNCSVTLYLGIGIVVKHGVVTLKSRRLKLVGGASADVHGASSPVIRGERMREILYIM